MSEENLGATGQFPRGKLNEHDEGELRMAVVMKDDHVMLYFGKPIAWLGLDPVTARAMGQSMIEKANEIERRQQQPTEKEPTAC